MVSYQPPSSSSSSSESELLDFSPEGGLLTTGSVAPVLLDEYASFDTGSFPAVDLAGVGFAFTDVGSVLVDATEISSSFPALTHRLKYRQIDPPNLTYSGRRHKA